MADETREQRLEKALFDELERQHELDDIEAPYLYGEHLTADGKVGIDGVLDVRALVRAICEVSKRWEGPT